jgi:hypothetical protein
MYLMCTFPYRQSGGVTPSLTLDQIQGLPEPTEEYAYSLHLNIGIAERISSLMGFFGYSYVQARCFSPYYARWFIEFRDRIGI